MKPANDMRAHKTEAQKHQTESLCPKVQEVQARNALSVGAARGAGSHSAWEGETLTGAQAIIASLECEGVTHVFGYPGAQAIALYDALYDSPITHVLARHEQAAVHEADGFARATGNVGVVLVTSGPGATNTVTGIANAYLDSIPLVVITGQVPTNVIGTDAFQESDTMSITMPVVKHSFLAQDAKELPRIIRHAFHIALTGRPGPVLIDVPSNIANQTLTFSYPERVNIPSYKPTYKCNIKQARAAAALLKTAKRPVVLAGGGVISSGAQDQLHALAHLICAPVALTLMGKGSLATSDTLNLGAVGMHGSARSNTALMESDVLLAVGTRLSDRVTGNMAEFAPNAKLIHIDIDPAEIGKLRKADVPIVGDAQAVLSGIITQLEKEPIHPSTQDWLTYLHTLPSFNSNSEDCFAKPSSINEGQVAEELMFATLMKEANAADRAPATSDTTAPDAVVPDTLDHDAITPRICMQTLGCALAEQEVQGIRTIVTTEVGQHQMWAAQYLSRNTPRSFLSSGGLGTMGFGFPAAIGASLAYPTAQVVCIAGDGSFQMNIQELATARAYNAAVKLVLIDNKCLGMVHQWQQFFYNKRYSQTELHANPNFVALADAYGWKAKRVQTTRELEPAFREMLASSEPFLLDVVISETENVLPMIVPGGSLLQRISPNRSTENK